MSVANEKTSLEEEIESLSHQDLCEITQSSLRTLIASDDLLKDLPVDCTIDEVNAQIAVAHGQSITVHILRNLESTLDVVVSKITTIWLGQVYQYQQKILCFLGIIIFFLQKINQFY